MASGAEFQTNPMFDLAEKPIFDTSVAKRDELMIREAGNTVDFSNDPNRTEFIFRLTEPNSWYLLSEGYFNLRFKIVNRANGNPMNAGEGTVPMGGWSLFEYADLSFGEVPIEQVTGNLGWQMLVKSLVKYSRDGLDCHAKEQGTYIESGAGGVDKSPINSIVTQGPPVSVANAVNTAYNEAYDKKVRRWHATGSNEVELKLPLKHLFDFLAYHERVVRGYLVSITMRRRTASDLLFHDTVARGGVDGRILLTHLSLWVPSISPSAATLTSLIDDISTLDQQTAWVETSTYMSRTLNATGGAPAPLFIDGVEKNYRFQRVYVVFLPDACFTGDQTVNPNKFVTGGVSEIFLMLNSQSEFPSPNHFRPVWNPGAGQGLASTIDVQRIYNEYVRACQGHGVDEEVAPALTLTDFIQNYPIYTFDLTAPSNGLLTNVDLNRISVNGTYNSTDPMRALIVMEGIRTVTMKGIKDKMAISWTNPSSR